jgi:uncharacterized membrane protein
LLPVILTLYLLYWFVLTTEAILGNVIRDVVSEEFYKPGMGVVAGLIVTFFVGLIMQTIIARQILSYVEQLVKKVPSIKSVYLSIRDFLNYFSSDSKKDFEQVVSVTIGETGMQLIGLVTQVDMSKMPVGFNQKDSLLVYIPMSYGIGGFAVLVPRKATKALNMSMEDAMRFTLTAGVTGNSKSDTV